MAEQPDKDSKTEEATAHKVEESIKKGNTPVSRDMAQFASILAIAAAVPIAVPIFSGDLRGFLAAFIERPYDFRLNGGTDAQALLMAVGAAAGWAALLPLGVLMAFGLTVALVQSPLRFVGRRIKPEFSRISVVKGLSRTFGSHGRAEFFKALLKLMVLSSCAAAFLAHKLTDFVNVILLEPTGLPDALAGNTLGFLLAIAVGLVAIAAGDIAWTYYRWRKELRMSRQEVIDEHKQAEGDPILRSRRLSIARDRSRRRMLAAVPRATVVIANPTHYAVALRYVRGDHAAPVVVAKGLDNIALRIREIAKDNNIPVIEDKALARSLHAAVSVDRPIPPDFYKAIAEIILFLMSRAAAAPAIHLPRGA
jgi:flagellar biosynthesis protein FlhB